jgi:CHAT domain-containing protein
MTQTVADARSAPRANENGELRKWRPLPNTRAEILTLRDSFEQRYPNAAAKVLRQEQATEAEVRRQAPRHRYLHLATHGFFDPPGLRSALAPAQGDDPDALFGREGVVGFHPGLLSGLVLAGANQPIDPNQDDGILTALEVAALDLSGVELATLSACETGLGEIAGGEGLLGLQRAFQVAGARSVVASLWKVDDVTTQLLMMRFYENLWQAKEPKSKLEALREAQLYMLNHGLERGMVRRKGQQQATTAARTSPYFWAAFVLSGDWR